ncbi:MAG: cyclic nucleotide-binding domain-containing protein [Archangium sp.]
MKKADDSGSVKIELKRAEIGDLLAKDAALASAPVVKLLGVPTLSKGQLRRFPDQAVLFQQGDAGDSLFIVISGEVRLFARKDRDSVELGHVHKGEVFAEGSVLEGGGRKKSAVAQGQVDVLELPRSAVLTPAGTVFPVLATLLKDVHQRRMKALDEMNDFLNRW